MTDATSASDIDRLAAALATAIDTEEKKYACDALSDDCKEESK